jgi:hypothetical protein
MGDPLSSSAKLDISTALHELTLRYDDSCGQIQEIPLGGRIHEAVREGIHRTFKTVIDERDGSITTPDYVIHVELIDSSFTLNKEVLYDRAPASLQLKAMVHVYDRTGELLRQTDIKIARQERLRLEQLAKNCNYMIEPFLDDTVIDFATRVALNARLAAGGQEISLSAEQNPALVGSVDTSSASPLQPLRFKAVLLDENSNLVFEGGEHVRVRVDIVNTGTGTIENASASLTGTPTVIERFPTTSLRVPLLRPGQTQSVEFMATLPMTVQPMQAEIHVDVAETGGAVTPSQTLSFRIEQTGRR